MGRDSKRTYTTCQVCLRMGAKKNGEPRKRAVRGLLKGKESAVNRDFGLRERHDAGGCD